MWQRVKSDRVAGHLKPGFHLGGAPSDKYDDNSECRTSYRHIEPEHRGNDFVW